MKIQSSHPTFVKPITQQSSPSFGQKKQQHTQKGNSASFFWIPLLKGMGSIVGSMATFTLFPAPIKRRRRRFPNTPLDGPRQDAAKLRGDFERVFGTPPRK